jgi:hypothetical protein
MTFGKACGSLSERCYDLLAEFSVAGSFLHVHPCWNSTRLCLRWCGVDLSPRPSFLKNWNLSSLSLLHLDGHMLYVILSFRVTLFFSWHDVKYDRAEILLTWQVCKDSSWWPSVSFHCCVYIGHNYLLNSTGLDGMFWAFEGRWVLGLAFSFLDWESTYASICNIWFYVKTNPSQRCNASATSSIILRSLLFQGLPNNIWIDTIVMLRDIFE